MRRSRDIVLIRMHEAFNTSGQVTLAAPEMSGKSNEVIFHDLVLQRPPPGTFNLVIYTDPLDSMLDSATIQITVHPGRAHHLGISAPCEGLETDIGCALESTTGVDYSQHLCTCVVYNVSAIVPLSLLQLYILDGAENILYGTHDPACRVGTSSCPLQKYRHGTSKDNRQRSMYTSSGSVFRFCH